MYYCSHFKSEMLPKYKQLVVDRVAWGQNVSVFVTTWIAEEGFLSLLHGCPFPTSSLTCDLLGVSHPKAHAEEYLRNFIFWLEPKCQNSPQILIHLDKALHIFYTKRNKIQRDGSLWVGGKWLQFKLYAKGWYFS